MSVEEVAEDIVSVLNLDCFMEIRKYLTEPQDILAFAQASNTLNEWMEERGDLLKVVIPDLKCEQRLNIFFKLRATNKRVKKAVDSYLHHLYTHQFSVTSLPSYFFDSAEKMEAFLKMFRGHGKNPFITPSCRLIMTDGQTYNNALAILVEHGKYIECVELNLAFQRSPQSILVQLAELLTNLKNVERLEIVLTSDFLHSPTIADFPSCPRLTQLRFDINKVNDDDDEDDENQDVERSIVRALYNSIISKYENQLTRICVPNEFFNNLNFRSWFRLSNIQRLKVFDSLRFGDGNWGRVISILSLVGWSHLVKLELHFEGSFAELTKRTLKMISRFRFSLQILRIGSRRQSGRDDDLVLDTTIVDDRIEELTFENLIKLNMNHPDDFSFRTWDLVARLFPNLEKLIFREYLSVQNDEVKYEHVKYFFQLFPRLRQVVLKRNFAGDYVFERRSENDATPPNLTRLELGWGRFPETALDSLLQNLPTDKATLVVVVYLHQIIVPLPPPTDRFQRAYLPPPVSLPVCHNLNHLDVRNIVVLGDMCTTIMCPLLSSLFRSYETQLTKLSTNVAAFWSGLSVGDWNSLRNLQSLRVDINCIHESYQNMRWSYVFDILCQVSWPQLAELSLGNAPSASWNLSYLMVMAFKNLQTSLKTLCLLGEVDESGQILEFKDYAPILMNLTKLEVGITNVSIRLPINETDSRMWNLFTRHSPNLRNLDLVWISQDEEWHHIDVSPFYQMFPEVERVQLKAISGRLVGSWERKDLAEMNILDKP